MVIDDFFKEWVNGADSKCDCGFTTPFYHTHALIENPSPLRCVGNGCSGNAQFYAQSVGCLFGSNNALAVNYFKCENKDCQEFQQIRKSLTSNIGAGIMLNIESADYPNGCIIRVNYNDCLHEISISNEGIIELY